MPATLTKEDEAALSPREIVRAWEDRKFRARLSPERRLRLPAHPAGDARLENLLQEAIINSASSDNCSSSNCSSSNCSSDNCSSSNCSSDNCSSSNCSGNLCTNWDCGGHQ